MYIFPNTTLILLHNVPLDTTYEHTIYFNTLAEQESYFRGKAVRTFNNLTYQRYEKGSIRVEANSSLLYDCNYIMFKNTSYGNKWFYAFVTSVQYINDNTTQIAYTLDYMQTWFFDYELKQCFVEREHSATDVIGENTVPESFPVRDYVITDYNSVYRSNTNYITVFTTENVPPFDPSYEWDNPDISYTPICTPTFCDVLYGNVISMWGWRFKYDNVYKFNYLSVFLNRYAHAGKSDSIICVFFDDIPVDINGYTNHPAPYITTQPLPTKRLTITPKNNKLYTYPFTCMELYAPGGSSSVLHFELFDSDGAIEVSSVLAPSSQTIAYPVNYAGDDRAFEYSVTLPGKPLLPFIKDYYQNWLAQNRANIATSIITTGVSTTVGVATGIAGAGSVMATEAMTAARIGGAGASGFNSLLSLYATMEKAKVMPDSLNGTVGSGDNLFGLGERRIYAKCKTLKKEVAKQLDDFFSKYGYATQRNKIPNRMVRQSWTYVKTLSCNAEGSVPADDLNAICKVYDNGITFWRSNKIVGDYSQSNNTL